MENCQYSGYCPTGPVCNNHILQGSATGNRRLGFWEPTRMFSVIMFHENLRGHKKSSFV